MTVWLLDTNVISELSKPRPDLRVVRWVKDLDNGYLSVLTIGEVMRGVDRLRPRDPQRAARILVWARQVRREYQGRILPVDETVIERWAMLPVTRTLPVVDSLIAATALAHGLTVATRNTDDFVDAGVPVLNPFSTRRPAGETDGSGHS